MSFPILCTGCGAPSSPSVGICPYCKTTLASGGASDSSLADLQRIYASGNLQRALLLANEFHKTEEKLRTNVEFVILYAKILLDCEAPSSKVKSLLAEAFLKHPKHLEITDYLEMLEARSILKKGSDLGEGRLKSILRRSPQNFHASFFLGAHYFWSEAAPMRAISYLEACVRMQPNSLRAWGCLGAIYQKMGNVQLASNAFQKCLELETEPTMKEFFSSQLVQIKRAA